MVVLPQPFASQSRGCPCWSRRGPCTTGDCRLRDDAEDWLALRAFPKDQYPRESTMVSSQFARRVLLPRGKRSVDNRHPSLAGGSDSQRLRLGALVWDDLLWTGVAQLPVASP